MRRLARVFAALILLLPVNSYALGLGEIELHSALNQPLNAEISLLSADSVNPEELKVELASSDVFAQAEVERPVFLTKIKFEIDHKSDGILYINVTSEDSIKEPFIDFLVEVNWPNGRLLREYTVLLDPPVLLDEKPAPIDPVKSSAGKTSGSVPQRSRTRQTVGQVQSSGGGLQYGTVTRNDTLWSIASQLKPNNSVTVQQVMMALLKSNPEAFYNNNINELKAGYVLRISDPDLITAMNAEEALRESRLQYRQWLDAKQNAGKAPGQRPVGSDVSSSAVAATSTGSGGGAKLKLVAPTAEEEASTMTDSQAVGMRLELESLREELAVALETTDVTRQENEELRTRISAMEQQLASMQRLVTLKDDTMAAIQGNVAQPDSGTQATDNVEEAPAVEMNVPQTTQQPAPPPAAAPPPAPAAAPTEEGAFSMLLKDPVTLVVAGLIILVLIVLVWMKIRQRQQAADGFDEGILAAAEQFADESDSAMATAVGAYAADSAMDAIQTDSDEMDVLAEADVYLAYRRFDKAIELLNEALQNEPNRSDYKLKLMEVYEESENVDGFIAQAEQFYATIGPQGGPDWDRVVAMGKKLTPEHPLFSNGESAARTEDTGGTTDYIDDSNLGLDSPESSEDKSDPLMSDFDMEEGLSYKDTAEQTSEESSDDIFDDSIEDSETTSAESESPDLIKNEDLTSSFSMTEDELESGSVESEVADVTADKTPDSDTDDDALNFDFKDEAETSTEPTAESAMEELSFEESGSVSEEPIAEDKSNVIDFESGLTPSTETKESQESIDDDATTSAGESWDAIEFETGLAPEKPSEEGKDEDITTADASAEDVDSPENILEYDLESMSEKSATDDGGITFNEEDGLSGVSSSAEELVEEPKEVLNTDTDDDLELNDDLDWLSNIDDDISLDDNSSEESATDNDLVTSGDEVDTKLDLAKAYIDMDDKDSARDILDEVANEGNEEQKREAEELMQQIA